MNMKKLTLVLVLPFCMSMLLNTATQAREFGITEMNGSFGDLGGGLRNVRTIKQAPRRVSRITEMNGSFGLHARKRVVGITEMNGTFGDDFGRKRLR